MGARAPCMDVYPPLTITKSTITFFLLNLNGIWIETQLIDPYRDSTKYQRLFRFRKF